MLTVAAYIIFVWLRGISEYHKAYIARKNARIMRAVQREISNAMLPMFDLQLTDGDETPDEELNEDQRFCKQIANGRGFKVEKIPFATHSRKA